MTTQSLRRMSFTYTTIPPTGGQAYQHVANVFLVEPYLEGGQLPERLHCEAHPSLGGQLVDPLQGLREPSVPHSLHGEIMHVVSHGRQR